VVFSNLCSSGSLDAAAWPFSLRTLASFLDVSSDVSGRKKPPGARCDRAMRPRSSLATPSTTFAAALTVADVDDAGIGEVRDRQFARGDRRGCARERFVILLILRGRLDENLRVEPPQRLVRSRPRPFVARPAKP
jgi:hypothetical protein